MRISCNKLELQPCSTLHLDEKCKTDSIINLEVHFEWNNLFLHSSVFIG